MKVLRATIVGLFQLILVAPAIAQNYGQGAYNSLAYGSGVIQIGPLTLPVTGAGLLAIGSAVLISAGVGLLVWTRGRHHRKA